MSLSENNFHTHSNQAGLIYLLFFFVLLTSGCSKVGIVTNEALSQLPPKDERYTFTNHALQHSFGDIIFLVAFSGGGTRAAAMSYGVLEELRDTSYLSNGQQVRLLEEVDRISSVSGGSFTSAYYGLFGDKIFEDFKDVFLYKNVQGALKSQILRLVKVLLRQVTLTSRTENAIRYYDKHIFKGKTFADFQNSDGPFIIINATDLNSKSQFTFTQRQFDFLCSDLSQFQVARAVAASSAVPVLFQPILIKKHPDCNFQKPKWLGSIEKKAAQENDQRLQEIANSMNFYLDKDNPPYVTLVDGGITDNLGLRAALTNVRLSGGAKQIYRTTLHDEVSIKHVVILVVNAEVGKDTKIGNSTVMPSTGDVLNVVTGIQLHLYNIETKELLKHDLIKWAQDISSTDKTVHPYFIEIKIDDIDDKEERQYLNKVPTSFVLKKEQADRLIGAAKHLLRKNPEYQRLLGEMGASQNPLTDEGEDL